MVNSEDDDLRMSREAFREAERDSAAAAHQQMRSALGEAVVGFVLFGGPGAILCALAAAAAGASSVAMVVVLAFGFFGAIGAYIGYSRVMRIETPGTVWVDDGRER